MAQDSEKRFHSIMDKLFQSPQSTPTSSSCSGVETRRGTKRRDPESALAPVEPKGMTNAVDKYHHSSASAGSSQAPVCRPWERGDLMRRVAKFKSMTWFAKPKAVSAVNCARRGWINVDMDTIACESCGSRLLFSTPSSWTKQQVEKAALVFSLKLDNGHKLLCPWIDNICDETLAQFPPTPPPVLIDKFIERSSALLQLLALPVVSPSAIDYMRSTSSLLEEFLKSSFIAYVNESMKGPQTDSLSNECEDHSASLYYQALKLISLCGWEPRSLPYLVDCEEGVNQSIKDINRWNSRINIQTTVSNEIVELTENAGAHTSIVLDCRLCGASVGLWALSTVGRPLEFVRLVGYAEVNGQNNSSTCGSGNENNVDNREVVVYTAANGKPSYKESSSNLNLTIAGGPLPKKQNFKATISLPVIGRALRAKFSYDSDFRDSTFGNQEEIQSESRNDSLVEEKDHSEHNHTEHIVQAEDTALLNKKLPNQGSDCSIDDDQSTYLNNFSEKGDTFGKENANHMPVEGTAVTKQVTSSETVTHCATVQNPSESELNIKVGQSQSDRLPESASNIDSAVEKWCHSEAMDSSANTQDANLTSGNGEGSRNEKSLIIMSDNAVATGSRGKDRKQPGEEKLMKFDPIRQHRHFCPWIISTGSGSPGWQQTLSALDRQRERSHSSPSNSPPSSSMIRVDDPITSVRKLFSSPVTKRMKPSHESR